MRQISKEKYLIAGVITMGIFFLGLMLGLVIEGKRVEYIQSSERIQSLDYESLQIQYAYVDALSREDNCEAVSKTFEDNIRNLEDSRIRLENFDENSRLNKEEFGLLKREYILAQIRYWLLARRTKTICDRDIVTVLYFFSDGKDCPDCDEQAFVLTYLKKTFKDRLLIFSFDSRMVDEEPMIILLEHSYSIDEYPSLVIDRDVYPGLQDKKSLLGIICDKYSKVEEICSPYLENEAS